MKKTFRIFAALLLAVCFLMAGCGSNEKPEPTQTQQTSAAPTPTATAQATPEPTKSPEKDPEELLRDFFGGDMEGTLQKLNSLIYSVTKATADFGGFSDTPSDSFAWDVAYSMINTFEELPASGEILEDLSISVEENDILGVFHDYFSKKFEKIPPISQEYADCLITYIKGTMCYVFQRAFGDGYSPFFLSAKMLDNGNAELTYEMRDISEEIVVGHVIIELCRDQESSYGYSVAATQWIEQ